MRDRITRTILKGLDGERIIKGLAREVVGDCYIDDVYLETPKGKTQIDGIAVNRKGIFVLEVKNIKGRIIVDEDKETWTSKQGSRSYEIYSPLLQNLGHMRHLRLAMGRYKGVMHNIILFPDTTEVKGECSRVFKYSELEDVLSRGEDILTQDEVRRISEELYDVKKKYEYLQFEGWGND